MYYTATERQRMRVGRCPSCDELPANHMEDRLPCQLGRSDVEAHLAEFRRATAPGRALTPPDRPVLGVAVNVAGESPQQFSCWQDALAYVDQFAAGDDPVQVSMVTLYQQVGG